MDAPRGKGYTGHQDRGILNCHFRRRDAALPDARASV